MTSLPAAAIGGSYRDAIVATKQDSRDAATYARISRTTFPATSVSR